jgi:hypothetical protein
MRPKIIPKVSSLTNSESKLVFSQRFGVRASAFGGVKPRRESFSAESYFDVLVRLAGLLRKEGLHLFILEKGKPVERPGRKAKGRRDVTDGSLAAEGMMRIIFGKRTMGRFVVTNLGS